MPRLFLLFQIILQQSVIPRFSIYILLGLLFLHLHLSFLFFLLLKCLLFGVCLQGAFDQLSDLHLVLRFVLFEHLAGYAIGRGEGIGVCKQQANCCQDGPDVIDGTPLVLQHVEADPAVVVDVRVEHLAGETH